MTPDPEYRPPRAELPEPHRRAEPDRFRIIPVLVAGIGVDVIGTTAAAALLAIPFSAALVHAGSTPEAASEELMRDPLFFWVVSAVGLGLTLLAGYVAGRWAGCRPEIHGAAAGITSLVVVLPSLWSPGGADTPAPDWLLYAGFVIHVPLACFGGWLAGRRMR